MFANNKLECILDNNALALASAAKPILRTTAEKKINEFLERVRDVNRNEYYKYKIINIKSKKLLYLATI